jgi:hypothetical protein
MAYKFDPNKHKQTFNNMFGSGSFDRGLSSAREVGRLQAQAEFEKAEYKRRMSAAKKAAKEAEAAAKKAEKEEQKRRQEEAKIAARNEASKRAPDLTSNQYYNKMNKVYSYGNQARMEADRRKRTIRYGDEPKKKKDTKKGKKKDDSFLDDVGDFFGGAWKGTKDVAKDAGKGVKNRAKVVTSFLPGGETPDEALKAVRKDKKSKASKEIERFALRTQNEGSIGIVELIDKLNGGKDNSNLYNARKGSKSDIASTIAGSLTPGALAYKGAKAIGLGAKIGKNATTAQKIGQYSKQGSAAGFLFGTGDDFVTEATYPNQRSISERALNVGVMTAGGAVLDPLISVGGRKLLDIIKKPKNSNVSNVSEQKTEQLLLNEGQKLINEPIKRKGLKYPTPKENKINEILGLPAPKTQTVIPAKRTSDEYALKLSRLFEEANKSSMPPGREREFVEDLWSRMADPNDPSLDRLIELATPTIKRMNMNPVDEVSKARQEFNNPFGFDKYSRFKSNQEVIPTPNEGKPLSFKRERFNPIVEQDPLKYIGKTDPMNRTKVIPNPPRIDDNYLNSLQFGDRIKVRKDRREIELDFVKREGDSVVVRRKNGKETVVPAELVTPPSNGLNRLLNTLNPKASKETLLPNVKGKIKGQFENISPKKDPGLIRVPDADNQLLKDIDPTKLKDNSGFKLYNTDFFRNGRDIFGENWNKVKERVFDPFDASKKARVEDEEVWLNKLKTEVVDKYGIKKGSKKSALVQKFGEKQIDLEELKRLVPKDWEGIVEADKWFRNFYDTWIEDVNAVRAKIYPNNPDMLVPKRNDYYRHFNELTGLENVKNLFDNTGGIDTSLIGKSEFTKPNSKFLSFAQKRGLGPFKNDAVGGALDYIRAATYAKHIDPHIPVFKQLQKELAEGTANSKNLTHYLEYLDDMTRDFAGKTNPGDRWLQKVIPGGRNTMGILHQTNNRIKRNTILMNLASAMAQGANIPNGVAFAKQYSVQGVGRSLKAVVADVPEMNQSGFLKERYGDKIYRQFDTRWFEQPGKVASWILETADRIGTTFIWNSTYAKGVAQGVKNPVKYADDMTRNLVAGRGIGEVPLAQKAKTFQFVAPFQLEVANLWQIQRDFIKAKDFGAIATLFVGNFMFNKVMEETRGSRVTFDPIAAMIDAMEEGLTPAQRGGRFAGEVLSNVPLGQTVAAMYPEYGTKIAGVQLPTRESLFGDRNPTRFGTSILAVKGLQDPLWKLAPPLGGLQAQKTWKGFKALKDEGVYNRDKDRLQYPVKPDLNNKIKALLFGPYATDESKEYYKNDRTPLGVKQTDEYEQMKKDGRGNEFYNNVLIERLRDNYKEISNDESLSQKERKQKLAKLLEMLENLKR